MPPSRFPPLSILDLSPIVEGGDAGQSLRNSIDLARHAERWGYRRYWLAEHHGLPGVASAATAVVIGYVANATETIRVGAGGIMLPNHAPLVIAEQFGTLATMHPGRIDLGIGRAPGADALTMRALRRNLEASGDDFPQDVLELMAYFQPTRPGQRIQAVPGAGIEVPVWILGSSLYGAQLAAALGLPYAFASHFAPAELETALALYRERFVVSGVLAEPYVMVGINVTAADTDAEAKLLFSSVQQAFVNMRTGRPGRLPPPVENYEATIGPQERALLGHALSFSVVGSPETVRHDLAERIARVRPDELMVTAQVFDHEARLRSFEILAEVAGSAAA